MSRRWLYPLAALLVIGLAAISASKQGDAQAPQTVQPGTAAIWTDKSAYNIGDLIQYCYRIPIAGYITITDFPANGTSNLIFAQVVNGTSACLTGTITPPSGHECLGLTYPLAGGTGSTRTCFTVLGAVPPVNPLAIYTDKSSYLYGDYIDVCYRVPSPGPFTILDRLANGVTQTFSSGYDDGTGGCLPGVVTPPAGQECMTINFTYANGSVASAQTCFQVSPRLLGQ